MSCESWHSHLDRGIAGTYIIRHLSSSKAYVGSATDLRRRRSEHWRELQRGDHDNKHLQRAWKKYGPESFVFEVVELCAACETVPKEQLLLDAETKRVGWRNLYNQSRVAGSRLGVRHKPATRKKMSENNTRHFAGKTHTKETKEAIAKLSRERWNDPEYRAKCSGNIPSMEKRKKIGDANRGRVVPASVRARISASLKGRPMHPNTRASLTTSPRMRGKKHSEETKAKISAIHRGRVFTDEEKKKISEGVRRWRAQKAAKIQASSKEAAPCPN